MSSRSAAPMAMAPRRLRFKESSKLDDVEKWRQEIIYHKVERGDNDEVDHIIGCLGKKMKEVNGLLCRLGVSYSPDDCGNNKRYINNTGNDITDKYQNEKLNDFDSCAEFFVDKIALDDAENHTQQVFLTPGQRYFKKEIDQNENLKNDSILLNRFCTTPDNDCSIVETNDRLNSNRNKKKDHTNHLLTQKDIILENRSDSSYNEKSNKKLHESCNFGKVENYVNGELTTLSNSPSGDTLSQKANRIIQQYINDDDVTVDSVTKELNHTHISAKKDRMMLTNKYEKCKEGPNEKCLNVSTILMPSPVLAEKLQNKKRAASTSGKKGCDLQRIRRSEVQLNYTNDSTTTNQKKKVDQDEENNNIDEIKAYVDKSSIRMDEKPVIRLNKSRSITEENIIEIQNNNLLATSKNLSNLRHDSTLSLELKRGTELAENDFEEASCSLELLPKGNSLIWEISKKKDEQSSIDLINQKQLFCPELKTSTTNELVEDEHNIDMFSHLHSRPHINRERSIDIDNLPSFHSEERNRNENSAKINLTSQGPCEKLINISSNPYPNTCSEPDDNGNESNIIAEFSNADSKKISIHESNLDKPTEDKNLLGNKLDFMKNVINNSFSPSPSHVENKSPESKKEIANNVDVSMLAMNSPRFLPNEANTDNTGIVEERSPSHSRKTNQESFSSDETTNDECATCFQDNFLLTQEVVDNNLQTDQHHNYEDSNCSSSTTDASQILVQDNVIKLLESTQKIKNYDSEHVRVMEQLGQQSSAESCKRSLSFGSDDTTQTYPYPFFDELEDDACSIRRNDFNVIKHNCLLSQKHLEQELVQEANNENVNNCAPINSDKKENTPISNKKKMFASQSPIEKCRSCDTSFDSMQSVLEKQDCLQLLSTPSDEISNDLNRNTSTINTNKKKTFVGEVDAHNLSAMDKSTTRSLSSLLLLECSPCGNKLTQRFDGEKNLSDNRTEIFADTDAKKVASVTSQINNNSKISRSSQNEFAVIDRNSTSILSLLPSQVQHKDTRDSIEIAPFRHDFNVEEASSNAKERDQSKIFTVGNNANCAVSFYQNKQSSKHDFSVMNESATRDHSSLLLPDQVDHEDTNDSIEYTPYGKDNKMKYERVGSNIGDRRHGSKTFINAKEAKHSGPLLLPNQFDHEDINDSIESTPHRNKHAQKENSTTKESDKEENIRRESKSLLLPMQLTQGEVNDSIESTPCRNRDTPKSHRNLSSAKPLKNKKTSFYDKDFSKCVSFHIEKLAHDDSQTEESATEDSSLLLLSQHMGRPKQDDTHMVHSQLLREIDNQHNFSEFQSPAKKCLFSFSSLESINDDDSTQPESQVLSKENDNMIEAIESCSYTFVPRRERALRSKTNNNITAKLSTAKEPEAMRLKEGRSFRMQPLQMKSTSNENTKRNNTNKKATSTFRPFLSFTSRTISRLNETTEWLIKKECQEISSSQRAINDSNESCDVNLEMVNCGKKGVLLSLTADEIKALVLKFILKIGARHCASNLTQNDSGGTLIVLRDKEEIASWEHDIRENSSLSLWTHVKKPPKTSIVTLKSRLAGYDIVLTTFDAIKAKDITQPVDEHGQALTRRLVRHDGWYDSTRATQNRGMMNSSSHTKCLQLSVAHGIRWSRVIFLDKIGKSSYITKPKTARAIAGKALVGRSRFIFLAKSDDHRRGKLENNLKEDNKLLLAIASMLYIPDNRAADIVVGQCMVDFDEMSGLEDRFR